MSYTLPSLPYSFNALEPHIDARTMEIHYTKHHQGYIDKLNAVLEKYPRHASQPVEHLLEHLEELDMETADKVSLRNNGGGVLNHNLFWHVMGPTKEVDMALVGEIEESFGSVDQFKKEFEANATARFGSGWSWLVRNSNDELELYSTPNQDSPYLNGHTPLLGLDVWEHAYYLQYQNRRPEYVGAWWQVCRLIP